MQPDEYDVMVVMADGYAWETYGVYQTRSEAQEAVKRLDPNKYRKAGIKPQIRAYRPFQTHIDSDERDHDEARIFAEYATKLRLAEDGEEQ